MSRLSYAKTLDKVLEPHGFQRDGNEWIRIRGDMWECVDLQVSWLGGVTANVQKKDLETDRILQSIACEEPLWQPPIDARIGHLIDGYDRWWKSDPNGPAELSAAVETYGLPWFDKVTSLEEQLTQWCGEGRINPWHGSAAVRTAITLYRLGRLEEALALFNIPVPRTAIPAVVVRGRCLQNWLKRQVTGG